MLKGPELNKSTAYSRTYNKLDTIESGLEGKETRIKTREGNSQIMQGL